MKILGLTGYKQSGKSTLAMVARTDFNFRPMAFADELKEIVGNLWPAFSDAQLYGELKEEVVKEYGRSAREVLQVVGTDLFRTYDPDVWVRALRATIKAYYNQMGPTSGRTIVIDDIRFDNEAALIHELGGEVWEVRRRAKGGRLGADHHPSEQGLIEVTPNMVILNSFGLDEYTAMCQRKLQEFVDGE